VLDVCDHLFEQLAHVVVVQFVDNLATISLTHDEAEVPEHTELVGDGRGLHGDGPRNLRHGRRPRV
jgi:hypothetical protein